MPGRHLTDHQVRLYMNLRRQDTPSVAAAKASFSTASAYRIESDPRPPSQKQTPRSSRRHDPQLPASVRRWRALHGPEQEVIFAQRNPPGRLGLSDFTATGTSASPSPAYH